MSAAAPVGSREAAALFAPLLAYPHLLLAVSGGADSTALMWLAARWRQEGGTSAFSVATVDHGLRPKAASECAAVAALARHLELPCTVLRRDGPAFKTRIQEQARSARYRLLEQAARLAGAQAIVTAHTLDDQAETILMRLAHGSGLDGLAGMRVSRAGGAAPARLRPLIGLPKARLVATLVEAGVPWIEDPSNADPRFERVRWRSAMADLSALGLDPPTLALLAVRTGRAVEALDGAAQALFERHCRREGDTVTIERDSFLGAPAELRLRLLAKALASAVPPAPGAYPWRLERLETLAEAFATAKGPLRRTLAGAVVSLGNTGPLTLKPEGMRRRGH